LPLAGSDGLEGLIGALKGDPHVLEVYRVGSRSGKLKGYNFPVKLVAFNRV